MSQRLHRVGEPSECMNTDAAVMDDHPKTARQKKKRCRKNPPPKAAAIGVIHARGLRQVAAALQRELACVGLTPKALP